MTRADRIREALSPLAPTTFELRDDSAQHAGHAGAAPGGETHYHLVIGSEAFAHLSKVAAHQKIYTLLTPEFKSGLHALSIEIV